MKNHLHKFETTLWLFIKAVFYILLMLAFISVFDEVSIGLTRLSRTLGITVSTFVVVGLLFLSVYGRYDVGRRKSKPIIYSMLLAVICTDIITYLQLMIMKTSVSISTFRLRKPGLLLLVILLQFSIIVFFAYAGNWLFFKLHKPERCLVITASQKSLDEIVFAMQKFKKQYPV